MIRLVHVERTAVGSQLIDLVQDSQAKQGLGVDTTSSSKANDAAEPQVRVDKNSTWSVDTLQLPNIGCRLEERVHSP